MELRRPPRMSERAPVDRIQRLLLASILLLVIGLGIGMLLRPTGSGADRSTAEHRRAVAARLQAAGALDEAAALYEQYLELSGAPADERARVAFSLGNNYLETGRYDRALRWFYEAEALDVGELGNELTSRIVHCLDRLGRHHAAQAALADRVDLEAPVERPAQDPVVARIGREEIRRSAVLRRLDSVPPEVAEGFRGAEGQQQLLRKYVADELLWRKAAKLEYDRDPEVERRLAELRKQLAVGRFVDQELLAEIEVDAADLANFFEANRERYRASEADAAPTFEEVRSTVERDYRLMKLESAYEALIDSELSTQDVELFPERMSDAP